MTDKHSFRLALNGLSVALVLSLSGPEGEAAPHLVPEKAVEDSSRKKSERGENTSGYHNGQRSPSRKAGNDFHLLLPEKRGDEGLTTESEEEVKTLTMTLKVLRRGDLLSTYRLLSRLESRMPIDSRSRVFYRSLAILAKQQLDRDVWYRYERRNNEKSDRADKHVKLSLSSVSDAHIAAIKDPRSRSIASLRLETWMLLTGPGSKR